MYCSRISLSVFLVMFEKIRTIFLSIPWLLLFLKYYHTSITLFQLKCFFMAWISFSIEFELYPTYGHSSQILSHIYFQSISSILTSTLFGFSSFFSFLFGQFNLPLVAFIILILMSVYPLTLFKVRSYSLRKTIFINKITIVYLSGMIFLQLFDAFSPFDKVPQFISLIFVLLLSILILGQVKGLDGCEQVKSLLNIEVICLIFKIFSLGQRLETLFLHRF